METYAENRRMLPTTREDWEYQVHYHKDKKEWAEAGSSSGSVPMSVIGLAIRSNPFVRRRTFLRKGANMTVCSRWR